MSRVDAACEEPPASKEAPASEEAPAPLDPPAWAQQARLQLQQAQLQGRVPIPNIPSSGPDRVFISSIPPSVSEQRVRQLLLSFGALQSFYMPSDRAATHRVSVLSAEIGW